MATPDMEHRSSEVEWSIRPAYERVDNDSTMVCAMTGFAKRDGEVVYRGPFVDEFYGFLAIGQDSAEQLARLIGYVDPDTIDDTVAQAAEALDRVAALEAEIAERDVVIAAYETIMGPLEESDEESDEDAPAS